MRSTTKRACYRVAPKLLATGAQFDSPFHEEGLRRREPMTQIDAKLRLLSGPAAVTGGALLRLAMPTL